MFLFAKKPGIALAIALLPVSLPALVFAAPGIEPAPGAGQLLQQLPPSAPPLAPPPILNITRPDGQRIDSTVKFNVVTVEIEGGSAFTSEVLHGLVADAEGKEMTLGDATTLASRLTDYYHDHGYPLARAVIPSQTLRSGHLKIQIVEAKYGTVNLDNKSLVGGGVLSAVLAGLRPGDAVSQENLDRALLLMSDMPGVTVDATLAPGDAVGSTNLSVTANPSARFAGNVLLDDEGNRYTGRARLSANLTIASPLSLGDQFNANVLTSGADLNDGGVTYSLPLNGLGTRLSANYSALDYRLGNGLSKIDGYGTARVADLALTQPFYRSTDFNVNGRIDLEHKQLDDSLSEAGIFTDRHTDAFNVGLAADWRDGYWGGGANTAGVTATVGQLEFDSAGAAALDASSVDAQGRYYKVDTSLARLQSLFDDTWALFSFSGQFTGKNLDSSEQILAGGEANVRGYDVGALAGDKGVFATAELRHRLGMIAGGALQGKVFADSGYVKVNENQISSGLNTAHLYSIGAGLDWSTADTWHVKLDVAKAVGSRSPLIENGSLPIRAWLAVEKDF